MAIIARCSSCGKQFQAEPHLAGKTVPCPSCGRIRILNVVRQDCKPTGPFFAAFCHSFLTFRAHFPLVLGVWWRVLPYSGMFYGVIIVGDGEWGWPDGFCGMGRAAVDTFEGRSPFEPLRGDVCCGEHTRTL